MSQTYSILAVDSNEAFAIILKEALEQSGMYRVTVLGNGAEALEAATSKEFDLAIVDLGLENPDGATLARAMRQRKPELRLMLIPLMGEELPPAVADLDIQGVLTKPFFFPELPGIVGGALARRVGEKPAVPEPTPVEEPQPAPEPPAETREHRIAATSAPSTAAASAAAAERLSAVRAKISERNMQKIVQTMTGLAQDIGAEAVILTCRGGLLAHAGRLPNGEAVSLAEIVGENWYTSARVATILGREQRRFEQSSEGGEHIFYSLTVADDIILSAAIGTGVPLGMIRHSAKTTADTLRRLVGA